MDFTKDNVNQIYRKYLVPTLGSALAMSIYSFVDTIAVGQYAGPAGSAALAVINPIYILMAVIAFLCSTGGSVRYGNALGEGKKEKALAYFTVSIGLCLVLTCTSWLIFSLFLPQILTFFGADKEVLPVAMAYGIWIIRFFPVIVIPDLLAPFIRIDKDPKRAMAAVITGGCINMFLNWFLVFPMNMGVKGAALATVIGTVVQCLIMLSHFFTKENHLHFVKPYKILSAVKNIITTGAPSLLLDLGNVMLVICMNKQMLLWGGPSALGIYGVINTISILCQALFAGVGQTIQPGVSVNHGAGKENRVREFYQLGVKTVLIMGIFFTVTGELFPNTIIHIFMKTTPEVLSMAPHIMRLYFLCFPFMGYCVLSALFLQSVLQQRVSAFLALMRSVILPLCLLYTLPLFLKANGVYITMPVSDCLMALFTALYLKKYQVQ